jgi:cytochrome c-type biogenesis protein CcmH
MFGQVLAAMATTVSEVEKHLMCTCGCTMALYTCECQTAVKMRAEIAGLIDSGMNKDQILKQYVARYGEKILSAPTKSGFNLTAWVLPFLVLGLATFGVVKVVKKWSASRKSPWDRSSEILPSDFQTRLKKELETFDEGDTI